MSGWLALWKVQEKERERAEEEARHKAESGDGEVIYHGRRPDDDEDDEITDGQAE